MTICYRKSLLAKYKHKQGKRLPEQMVKKGENVFSSSFFRKRIQATTRLLNRDLLKKYS